MLTLRKLGTYGTVSEYTFRCLSNFLGVIDDIWWGKNFAIQVLRLVVLGELKHHLDPVWRVLTVERGGERCQVEKCLERSGCLCPPQALH